MKRLRLRTWFLLAAIAVILAACSGSAGPAGGAPPLGGVGDPGGGFDGEQPKPAATAAPGNQPGAPDQALIIYTGTLDLEVADLRAAVDQANQLVAGIGGHVASSDTADKDGYQQASVTYRIPAERWDEALTGLRAIGAKVLGETTQSEDVTGQVVDLDARIANLRASETALQSIMARASTIPDVLKVQEELTSVRGDIESMTAQRESLANRAAFATLEVRFNIPAPAQVEVAKGGWDLGTEVDNAIAALVRVGQGLTTLALWVAIVVLPILIPIVVLLWIANRLRRRWISAHPRPAREGPPPWTPPL